jgi:hypothetical protein
MAFHDDEPSRPDSDPELRFTTNPTTMIGDLGPGATGFFGNQVFNGSTTIGTLLFPNLVNYLGKHADFYRKHKYPYSCNRY